MLLCTLELGKTCIGRESAFWNDASSSLIADGEYPPARSDHAPDQLASRAIAAYQRILHLRHVAVRAIPEDVPPSYEFLPRSSLPDPHLSSHFPRSCRLLSGPCAHSPRNRSIHRSRRT